MKVKLHPIEKESNFYVKCNCCGQLLENWVGSTPCCGSIAYACNGDGSNVSDTFHLYGYISNLNNQNNNPTNNDGWLTEKPVFTADCILLTATLVSEEWNYTSFEIQKNKTWNKDFTHSYYWGIYDLGGSEWGDIDDLQADRYKIVELPG